MIRYDFFEEDTLIIVQYPEIIEKDQIISFMEFVYHRIQNKKLKKILIDFRNCKPNFGIGNLGEIKNARVKFYDGLPTVYLVTNSIETAYTLYFAEHFNQIKICSTIDFAIKLLDLNTSNKELEEMIGTLSKQFK